MEEFTLIFLWEICSVDGRGCKDMHIIMDFRIGMLGWKAFCLI